MAKKKFTIQELAIEAKMDKDEVLLRLWNAGFSEIVNHKDKISGPKLEVARKVLGMPCREDIISPIYWQLKFNLSDIEFNSLLSKIGIQLNPTASVLPKGSVAKLKAEFNKKCKPNTEIKDSANNIIVLDKIVKQDISQNDKIEWKIIGHKKNNIRLLKYEEILAIHEAVAKDFAEDEDPIIPFGVRNEDLLRSAAFRPHTSQGTEAKYPTVEMAAAALLHSLVHNHPFHNGNKRTALVAMLVFLNENHFLLTCNQDNLFKFVLQVAKHQILTANIKSPDSEALGIAKWLHDNSREIERGNRQIPFRVLRKILNSYGCSMSTSDSGGSRMNISRTIEEKKFFGFGPPKEKTLYTQVFYEGEGREAKRDTIQKIRADLYLDEKYGIDAKAFYENAPFSADDFIIQYKETLHRLAKL